MTCDEIQERLGAFLDGEVSAHEHAWVREHIAACASCAAELEAVRSLAEGLAPGDEATVPDELWPSIAKRLDVAATPVRRIRPWWMLVPPGARFAAAAVVALILGGVGYGLLSLERPASASEIDFAVLLDALPFDVDAAFKRFVDQHKGERSTAEQAQRFASALNFAIPTDLHGGFRLKEVFILRIGSQPGVAARYDRAGEFLAAIFHPPVRKEDFGSHKDYDCVVGQHRGHAVSVSGWTMVHVTDPTTCHCVLSRLDQSELTPVLRAVAPDLVGTPDHSHRSGSNHP